jgi:hypothetical protein
MQPVEKQIKILANKVDDVYQILDRLHHHLVVDTDDGTQQLLDDRRDLDANFAAPAVAEPADWLVHQDVLVDSQGVEASHHHSELHLSPQSQIQRLTAQLTVAYSRIAALEEQLLSQRIN